MIEAGYWTWRFSAADFKVIVPDPEGGRAIDVFAGFVVEDVFYLMPEVAVHELPARRSSCRWARSSCTGGRITAPANAEALLEITYGPHWRVPDPSFNFESPRWVRRRLDGWLRGNNGNRTHWWSFYFGRPQEAVPVEPSPFARWVRDREPADASIVDIGAGTGRDSLWFARQGHDVLGLDYIPAATERAGNTARGRVAAGALQDGQSLRHPPGARDRWRAGAPGPRRRRCTAASSSTRSRTRAGTTCGAVASMSLRRGGRFYLEFRTGLDAGKETSSANTSASTSSRTPSSRRSRPAAGRSSTARPVMVSPSTRTRIHTYAGWSRHGNAEDTGARPGPAELVKRLARATGVDQELRRLVDRVDQLEREVQETRRLHQRLAELTDVVAEVLVPAADRDDARPPRETLEEVRQDVVLSQLGSVSADAQQVALAVAEPRGTFADADGRVVARPPRRCRRPCAGPGRRRVRTRRPGAAARRRPPRCRRPRRPSGCVRRSRGPAEANSANLLLPQR